MIFFVIGILFTGCAVIKKSPTGTRQAPEAERVLQAQMSLPFQVLIPAYLPRSINREKVKVITDQVGPSGEPMVQLIYSLRKGGFITLSEWIPEEVEKAGTSADSKRCLCVCRSPTVCETLGVEINVGAVRVRVQFSVANLLSSTQLQFVLDTLGPAINNQVYSSIKDVPISESVPPAVEIPVNTDGVQDLTLVVTPQGYTPVHFSVKKGIPVRLIFRQLGQVGCGNELVFQWGEKKSTTLKLDSAGDKKVFEFTPNQAGDFPFNCPHLIYRGVMTVTE